MKEFNYDGRVENATTLILTGVAAYMIGLISSDKIKYMLGAALTFGGGVYTRGCEDFNKHNKYSSKGIKIERKELGNEFSGKITTNVISDKNNIYLPRVDEEGNIVGLSKIEQVITSLSQEFDTKKTEIKALELMLIKGNEVTINKEELN